MEKLVNIRVNVIHKMNMKVNTNKNKVMIINESPIENV